MFKLLSAFELETLSDIELKEMILKLSQAISEIKSMHAKDSDGQKLYHLLKVECERRTVDMDPSKMVSV